MAKRAPDQVSRRSFVVVLASAGGGLLLGCRVGDRLQGKGSTAAAATEPSFAPNAFVRIGRDGRVTMIVGQVEMGQGMYTSMPMLIAEELEVPLDQVRVEHAPPNDKLYANPLFGDQETGASTSVRMFYEPLRRAGATARTMLVTAAAETWKVDPGPSLPRTPISPPWLSTMVLQIESPIPIPPCLVVWNGWKMRSLCSGATPIPPSRTSMRMRSSSRSVRTRISRGRSWTFFIPSAALTARLTMTC